MGKAEAQKFHELELKEDFMLESLVSGSINATEQFEIGIILGEI